MNLRNYDENLVLVHENTVCVAMFDCEVCKITFPTGWKLRRHLDKHTIFGGTMCMLCDVYFRRIDALVDHWRKTCKGMICVLSQEEREHLHPNGIKEAVFSYIVDLHSSNHLKPDDDSMLVPVDHTKVGHFCVYCNLLLTSSSLKRHHDIHVGQCLPGVSLDEQSYACDLCGLTFRMKHFLFKHWRESCFEVLAQIPPEGLVMRNSELVTFVADLVHRSSLIEESAYLLEGSSGEGGVYEQEPSSSGTVQAREQFRTTQAEHADDFPTRIIPPLSIDRFKWKVKHSSCTKCERTFVNPGRLERHFVLFHEGWRTKEKCPLCATRISRRSVFFDHLRKSCPAMKFEIPNLKARLVMSSVDISEFVQAVAEKWQKCVEKQKEINLEDMKAFLREAEKSKINQFTAPKLPAKSVFPVKPVINGGLFGLTCPVCKIKFQTVVMTQQHVNVVHPSSTVATLGKTPKTEAIVNAVIRRPVFYDDSNKQIRAGKFLSSDPMLTKQFDAGTVRANVRLKMKGNNINRTCMIVEIIGNTSKQLVILEEEEIDLALTKLGKLKTLYASPQNIYDDIPVLDREKYDQLDEP